MMADATINAFHIKAAFIFIFLHLLMKGDKNVNELLLNSTLRKLL